MALSILTLCIGLGCVRSVGSIALGSGILVFGTSFCGGLIVSLKVTCRGSVGMVRSSGIGSSGVGFGSGALLRILFSFVNASI